MQHPTRKAPWRSRFLNPSLVAPNFRRPTPLVHLWSLGRSLGLPVSTVRTLLEFLSKFRYFLWPYPFFGFVLKDVGPDIIRHDMH
ncbi:hypothetical protein HPB47_016190 [Ixodes persulcatus]|uniref:Uncharacterized protein n=1 Tax=Ixodes persulcatus TaxID=34615 RepID=A0AC60QRH5_IXOPE|nr:hypothetical protein HPB47_016190 [Ixodes persulcatus]